MDSEATPTLTQMPEGFYWKPRCQLDKLPTGLFLHGEIVASMLNRINGTWFARLHLDDDFPKPLVTRDCTSLEAGRRGAEMWAMRHEAELRTMVASKMRWIRANVARCGSGRKLEPG